MAKARPDPRVSITMPVYNASAYIESAIRALLNQTFTDFELIAVNDCSTDTSGEILDRLAKEDARIRVVHQQANGGAAKVTNLAISMARGEFIAHTDADDISEPERLAKQVAFLGANPQIGLVATQYWKLAADGQSRRKTRNAVSDAVLKFHLLFAVPVCHPTIVYRRKIALPLLPEAYDSGRMVAADHGFLQKMAKRTKFAVLPDYLFNYRIHAGGTGAMKKDMATNNIVASSRAYILETLPLLGKEWAVVEGFIRSQRRHDAMDAAGVKAYVDGFEVLRKAYVATLGTAAERRKVNAFCCEFEAKSLLGRHRIYRKPRLLLAWLLNPRCHLWQLPALALDMKERVRV